MDVFINKMCLNIAAVTTGKDNFITERVRWKRGKMTRMVQRVPKECKNWAKKEQFHFLFHFEYVHIQVHTRTPNTSTSF